MKVSNQNPFLMENIKVGDIIPFGDFDYVIDRICKLGRQEGTVVLHRWGCTPKVGTIIQLSESMVRDIKTRPNHFK